MASQELGNFNPQIDQGRPRFDLSKLHPARLLSRGNKNTDLSTNGTADDVKKQPESPSTLLDGEQLREARSIISDVLPHQLRDRSSIRYEDISAIMEWAKNPKVAGHIYQLESGPEELYKNRWGSYLEYYRGVHDDEGRHTEPRDVTFFKAVNSLDQIIAVTTVRWKNVDFVKSGRTAYWERLIVDPELHEMKIGLGFGIEVLDNIFYKADVYDGLPAKEARASTYADRPAGRHDINDNYLTLLGFKKHGDPRIVNGRRIQPYRATLADYETARPEALNHLALHQPERMIFLEKQGRKLQANLHNRTEE